MKEKIIKTANYLAAKGWAEAGSGNISIRANLNLIGKTTIDNLPFKSLHGLTFLITRSGSRFRRLVESDIGLVRVCGDGLSYEHDFTNGKPTSELYSHILIQQALSESPEKVVIHAHLTHIVALSHMVKDENDLNKRLFCITEMPVLLPNGIGFVPLAEPGSEKLGLLTVEKVISGKRAIVWAHHGAIVCGLDIECAIDQIEALEKAAQIAIMLLCRIE